MIGASDDRRDGPWFTELPVRAVAGVLVVACLVVALASTPALAQQPGSLEEQKLQQEIRQLELENDHNSGVRGFVGSYGAVLTGLAALGTVIVALANLARQRSLDRKQRAQEVAQQLDERFAATVSNLGDDSVPLQAGAAVSLLSFLRPEQRDYHRQVRLVALANLKVREPGPVSTLLVRVLGDALRTAEPLKADELDFADTDLPGIDLTGLDLRQSVLRKANLRDARLEGANLKGVKAYRVCLDGAYLGGSAADLGDADLDRASAINAVFNGATMNAVKLREADLTKARFDGARLQSAHFERARLEGARFRAADINDAYFTDSVLDEAALRELDRATNKWRAHFSPDVLERLRELDPQGAGEGAGEGEGP
jgi:hypothetical protein